MKSLGFVSSFLSGVAVLSVSSFAVAQSSPIMLEVGKARLSLASSLIKALDNNEVCETDAYPSTINETVSSATMQLEAADIQAWVSKIPSTSKMHADLAFRQSTKPVQLTDSKVSKAAVEAQLIGTKFHRFGMGVYGSHGNVTLGNGGVALVKTLKILDDEPYTEWVASTATWEVVVVKTSWGEKAVLKIGTMEYDFEQQSGEIWLKPANVPADELHSETLSTSDSYCEA